MIGLLQGLLSGTPANSPLPATSLSEKCGEDRPEDAYSEPADAQASFFSMLVQLFAPQSSEHPEAAGMAAAEPTDGMFAFATRPEGSEEVSSNARSLDPLLAKMTPDVSTGGDVESISGIVDALQESNIQVKSQRAQSSHQPPRVENGEQHEQSVPANQEAVKSHRAPEQPIAVPLQKTTEAQPSPMVQAAHDLSQELPAQDVFVGGSSGRLPSAILERKGEGFPLNWDKTGSSEIDRVSVRETTTRGIAEELQTLSNKFSSVGILMKREVPESYTRMNVPAGYSEDISTDGTRRSHTRDSANTGSESRTEQPQSTPRGNQQAVKRAGADQVPIPQPSLKIPELVSLNKENPADLPEQPTANVTEAALASEDSVTNTEHQAQPAPGIHDKGRTPTETKDVHASNQDLQSEAGERPVSFEFQHNPVHSRPETPNSFQTAEKPHSPVQLPQDFAQNLIVRISDELKAQIEGKSSEVRVVMKPESMGQLSLRVAMEEGRLVAILDVSKTAVKIALEAQLPQLREALAAQGISVERFDILSGSTTQFQRHGEGSAFYRHQHSRRQMDVDVTERYDTVKYLGYNTVEYII